MEMTAGAFDPIPRLFTQKPRGFEQIRLKYLIPAVR